ncbi:NF-kappa-B inhibitor delta [Pygocentrus nattereri]|uniref:NF-kappa-B inhibitor delta n=1 Tax=Pygocentrus nattereri TaxID=42514 RepID=A0AAR2K959_PYGNA|nr:NF-kappa-B inhibitor delta [Pygocentrus nattereri]
MHLQKSPKEKSCYTLPTVKKLLEQKRKRETSSAPPACAAASSSAGAVAPVPVSPSAPSDGTSNSYFDMAAMSYDRWDGLLHQHSSALQPCNSFSAVALGYPQSFSQTGVYSHSLPTAEPQASSYSPHQLQDCQDGQIPQNFPGAECPVTAALSGANAVTVQSSCYSWSSGSRPQAPAGPCSLQFRTQVDIAKLEEARAFLQGMDYSRTTWQDDDGDTILHIYTAKGQREYAFAAAEKLQELGRLDSKEHKGKTALLVAVTANQPEIVQDLLSLGADISICDNKGQTALHLAATYGFPQVMQMLLSMDHGLDMEARNFEGLTPLHCAVISHSATMKALAASSSSSTWLPDSGLQSQAENKLFCLQLLLDAGASPVSQEIKSNKTVLHLAVKEGNIQLVHFFLKFQLPDMQAFINMKAHGHTALHMAAGLHGNPHQEELIRLLLSRGADPSIRNLENDQPAHLLQSGQQGEKLKLILKKRNASSRRRIASLQDQE